MTRLSGSVEYVGCSATVRGEVSEEILYPDRVFCAKLVPPAAGEYLSYCFRDTRVRRVLETAAKSTAGHKRISMTDLESLALPMPPRTEQQAIIEMGEDQLSVIDHLEPDLGARLESAQALRQAILRHAFAGKLVAQDPNDEPASELLKRIAAEREARARETVASKRPAKPTRRRRIAKSA